MGQFVYTDEKRTTKAGKEVVKHWVVDLATEPPRPRQFKTKKLALGWLKQRDQ